MLDKLWISLSRVNDYMHHAEDVIMVSIREVICGIIIIVETFVLSNKKAEVELKTRSPINVKDGWSTYI